MATIALQIRGKTFRFKYHELVELGMEVSHLIDSPDFDQDRIDCGEVSPPRVRKPYERRSSIAPGKRFRVMERDGYKCRYCGVGADKAGELVVDHIQPLCKGGTNDLDNLAAACWECNMGKGGRSL